MSKTMQTASYTYLREHLSEIMKKLLTVSKFVLFVKEKNPLLLRKLEFLLKPNLMRKNMTVLVQLRS